MALIQPSPWMDAANFGQGLGSTLAQALIQMPAIKAGIAQQIAQGRMQQQEFGLRQQGFGLQQQEFAEQQRASGVREQQASEELKLRQALFKQQIEDRETQRRLGQELALSYGKQPMTMEAMGQRPSPFMGEGGPSIAQMFPGITPQAPPGPQAPLPSQVPQPSPLADVLGPPQQLGPAQGPPEQTEQSRMLSYLTQVAPGAVGPYVSQQQEEYYPYYAGAGLFGRRTGTIVEPSESRFRGGVDPAVMAAARSIANNPFAPPDQLEWATRVLRSAYPMGTGGEAGGQTGGEGEEITRTYQGKTYRFKKGGNWNDPNSWEVVQ